MLIETFSLLALCADWKVAAEENELCVAVCKGPGNEAQAAESEAFALGLGAATLAAIVAAM